MFALQTDSKKLQENELKVALQDLKAKRDALFAKSLKDATIGIQLREIESQITQKTEELQNFENRMPKERNFLEGKKALVISDDRHTCFILKTFLNKSRCNFDIHASSEEGIKPAATGAYDIVVLDMAINDKGADSIYRTVKARNTGMPIIRLTKDDHEASGARDALPKPLRIESLVHLLQKVLA